MWLLSVAGEVYPLPRLSVKVFERSDLGLDSGCVRAAKSLDSRVPVGKVLIRFALWFLFACLALFLLLYIQYSSRLGVSTPGVCCCCGLGCGWWGLDMVSGGVERWLG